MKTKITNMASDAGNKVPNQFIVEGAHQGQAGSFFQSYDTTIAFKPANGSSVTLDRARWDYSRTTAKYRNQFLGETTKETRAKIDSGAFILGDLNNV